MFSGNPPEGGGGAGQSENCPTGQDGDSVGLLKVSLRAGHARLPFPNTRLDADHLGSAGAEVAPF